MYKKNKGYALIIILALSLLSTSLVLLTTTTKINSEKQVLQSQLETEVARYVIEFSDSVYKLMGGYGGLPGDIISKDELTFFGLLYSSFPEKIGLGQTIRSYYTESPENPDVIDILTIIEDAPSELLMKSNAIDSNLLDRFYQNIASKMVEMGFRESQEDEVFIGLIFNNGKTLIDQSGVHVDISHVHHQYKGNTLGIYSKAPNQKGWWKFQVGPYIIQRDPYMVTSTVDGYQHLLYHYFMGLSQDIVNEGFSTRCPSEYTQIMRDEEYQDSAINISTDNVIRLCLEAYRGEVKANIESERYVQLLNPEGEASPEPFKSEPDLWGRCTLRRVDYTDSSFIPYTHTICVDREDLYSVVNESELIGLNKKLKVNTWSIASGNPTYNSLYNRNHINKYDYYIPGGFFANGIKFKLNNRDVQMYHISGSFPVGGTGTATWNPSIHRVNNINAMGVKISKNNLPNSVSIPIPYKDASAGNRSANFIIPTPLK